ncbi:hypothetical protein DFH28DRAFT_955943 [Melampsora americana]|nr:hypothetical protein DFH28DRAFT_955943 [Melampsora americana]
MMLCTQDKSQSSDTVGDMSPDTEKTLQKLCAALLPNVASSHQNKGDVSKSSGLGIELKLGLCAKITQSGESDGVKASDDQIGTSGKFLEGISFQLGISGGMGEDLKLGKISGPVVKSIKSDEGGCAESEGGEANGSTCSNCQSPCSSPKACGSGGKQSSNGSKGPTSDRKKTSDSQKAEKIPPADNTRAFPKDTSSSSGSKKSDKKSLTSPIDLGSLPVPITEAPITVPLSGNMTSPGGGQHSSSSSDSTGHNTPSGDGKKSNPLKDTGNLPGEPANLTNSGNDTSLDVGPNGTSSSDCTGCKKTKKPMKPEHSKKLEKSSKELNKSTSPMDQLNPSTKDTHDEESHFSTSQNVTVVGNDSMKSDNQIGSNVQHEEPLMIMGEDEGIQNNPSSEPKNPNPIGISSLVHVSNKTMGSEKKNKIQSKSSNPKNISDHSSQSMITPIPMNPDSSIFLN